MYKTSNLVAAQGKLTLKNFDVEGAKAYLKHEKIMQKTRNLHGYSLKEFKKAAIRLGKASSYNIRRSGRYSYWINGKKITKHL